MPINSIRSNIRSNRGRWEKKGFYETRLSIAPKILATSTWRVRFKRNASFLEKLSS